MLAWRVRMIDDKGQLVSYSWKGPEDGTVHAVIDGKGNKEKQSAKRDGNTLFRTGGLADGTKFEGHGAMSDDGNTLTDEITGKYKDGKDIKEKYVYHRVNATD